MGRYRSRSRSYSPRRRKRYDDPRDRRSSYRDRRSPAPSGLLVRNVALDTRPEELRIPFEKFGPVKDVYLPKNYYTGEPRGFGFVKFRYAEDAAEAKDRLNHTILGGREIRIVFAEENRKTPKEMRRSGRISDRYGGRRTPPRSSRGRYHSYSPSPSPSPARHYSRSRSHRSDRDYRSKGSLSPMERSARDSKEHRRRHRSRSPRDISPQDEMGYKLSRRSRSPREISPHDDTYRSSRRSPSSREISPPDENYRSNKRSPSPRELSPYDMRGHRSVSPRNRWSVSRSRSRSESPR